MQENLQQIPLAIIEELDNGIRHPNLYLWDAWSYIEDGIIHLYCLAVSRYKIDGTTLLPLERNNFPFHIRHFTSKNNGKNWKDKGCFLNPRTWPENFNYYTVWSGSIEPLPNGKKLAAFTVLEQVDAHHKFIQNIGLAISNDGFKIDQIIDLNLSSPHRDWEQITNKGYYLDSLKRLGASSGEEGGPILAWRDPFIFIENTNEVNLFWGGKVSPTKGALVRAELQIDGTDFKIKELHPPVTVPDGDEFTQLELPKVLYDKDSDTYYLIISTCNRLYEGQLDVEVDKGVRVYKSRSIDGGWESLGAKILSTENLFGPTVLKADFKNNRLLCIAPYTDAVEKDLRLTFSQVFYIYLDTLRVEFL